MAKKAEDNPPDQSWLLTFCDCMTLLLTFFVLLLSFSSFDVREFEAICTGFSILGTSSFDWIEDTPDQPKTSVIERMDPQDTPRNGPIIPTYKEEHDQASQAPIEILDMDLYQDRTVFYLPSQKFFWGQGVSMTSEGKDFLRSISGLFRKLPCRIVIAESSGMSGKQLGLRRSWAVLRYLTTREDIDVDRCTIATTGLLTQRFGGAILEISLMNIQVEE